MFEDAIDRLRLAVRAAQDALTAAQVAADRVALDLDTARAAAAAQASLAAARAEQARRAQELAAAQAAVIEWENSEPERELPNGKPNPPWLAWQRRGVALKAALTAAQQAAAHAAAAAKAAQAARDAALANLAAAQQRLTDTQTQVTVLLRQLTATESAVAEARNGVEAIADRLAELAAG